MDNESIVLSEMSQTKRQIPYHLNTSGNLKTITTKLTDTENIWWLPEVGVSRKVMGKGVKRYKLPVISKSRGYNA